MGRAKPTPKGKGPKKVHTPSTPKRRVARGGLLTLSSVYEKEGRVASEFFEENSKKKPANHMWRGG